MALESGEKIQILERGLIDIWSWNQLKKILKFIFITSCGLNLYNQEVKFTFLYTNRSFLNNERHFLILQFFKTSKVFKDFVSKGFIMFWKELPKLNFKYE